MKFESFIAWKHLKKRRKTGFISLISMISVTGVAVGVMALIVVLAVMSGFDSELKNKIVNVQPHLRIQKVGGVDNAAGDIEKIRRSGIQGIETVSAYVEGQAILRSERGATGVIVKGTDTQNENLNIYKEHLRQGILDLNDRVSVEKKRFLFFFKKKVQTATGSVLIGESLAATLGVVPGDKVSLIAPFQGKKNEISLTNAETKSFVVRGIFRVGMNDFDSSLALISLEQSQALYHLQDKVTGISVRFRDVDDAERNRFLFMKLFNRGYHIQSWYDMNFNFFQALKVEKSVMTILLALIILVAAFNIVSTLTMVVMEKTKDIGILRALGASQGSIRKIFVLEGLWVGLLGVFSGAAVGTWLALNLNPVSDFLKQTTGIEVFPSDIYYFDKIPAEVHAGDVVLIVIFAVIASVLAGLYPAQRAASLDPVEALRYE